MENKKKLLFLGGNGAMRDAVEIAKRKGIYTIVTDYYESSPAKEIADKAYRVSTTDVEALSKLVEEEKIDGVLTGYSDAYLLPARMLADRFGMYFYANEEQVEVTTNKLLFKKTCREHGIPVVPEFDLDKDLKPEDLAKITYPVIVKPSDAWASKGVSVCQNEEELIAAVDYALQFSKNQRIIVEQYMAAYPDVCMYLVVHDGKLYLAAMCERDMNKVEEGKAMQPNALFYPCRFINLYYEQLETKLQEMITALDMKVGTMFMQCFVVDGMLMPFEMGYRLCGAQEYILCNAENGVNSCEMLIDYALTGKFGTEEDAKKNDPYFKHSDAILLTLVRPGKITKIDGLDELKRMKEILNITQFYHEGDEIAAGAMGTLNQTFARIFVQADNPEHLVKTIDKIQTTLKIYDEQGNQMLIPGYDCQSNSIMKFYS